MQLSQNNLAVKSQVRYKQKIYAMPKAAIIAIIITESLSACPEALVSPFVLKVGNNL